jgi:hypothetical protein
MNVIYRQQAIEQKLKWFFTGQPCKYGHISERKVVNRACKTCAYTQRIAYYQENPERELVRVRERHKAYYQADPKKVLEANNAWRMANYERAKENQRKRNARVYAENPEHERALRRIWKANNPASVASSSARRRASKAQRTPLWLTETDHAEMRLMYKLANQKTKETGVRWHVDHIIPLHGKNVSGLHVPQNLRVISASENLLKNNKWELI